jgi:hypothetical protein
MEGVKGVKGVKDVRECRDRMFEKSIGLPKKED